jgi:hypothetical protein
MYYQRALEILGIDDDDGLTCGQLRRIYLRRLKDHPPERDPEGFRELREAFELAREYVADDPEPVGAQGGAVVVDASAGSATPKAEVFGAPSDASTSGAFARSSSGAAGASGAMSRAAIIVAANDSASAEVDESEPPQSDNAKFFSGGPPPPGTLGPSEPPSDNTKFFATDHKRPPTPPIAEPPVEPPVEAPRARAPEPPRDEPPPPPREYAPLPPLSTLRVPEPPLPLSVLVPKLLELLEAGHIATARDLEDDWRAAGDTDDYRQANAMIAARWALLRELLAVAAELPVQITKALAKALSAGDLAKARPELIWFRRANSAAAEAANALLAKRAPTIYRQIEGTLYVPAAPPPPQQFQTYTPPRRSRGAFGGVGIAAVIGMAVVRFIASGSSSHVYDYDRYKIPDIKMPDFDTARFALQPSGGFAENNGYSNRTGTAAYDPTITPPRPLELRDSNPETVWAQLDYSAVTLRTYSIASAEQQKAAALFADSVLERDCALLRARLAKLDAAMPNPDESKRVFADEHLAAIHEWLDLVCKRSKPSKPSKPSKAAENTKPKVGTTTEPPTSQP